MDKVKVLVLGLGNFGHSWAASVVPACGDCAVLAGVVDRDMEKWQGIGENVPKFQDLMQALEAVKPDLVVNVTPPNKHLELSALLLRKNIPVVCEKPLADNYENALELGKVLKETNGFLMISQNYRYHSLIRKVRSLLQENSLGKIHHVRCGLKRCHPDLSMFYHGTLKHPLLEDVAIHHLDLARYLTGEEPVRVWCREYPAQYSWYGDRLASAVIVTEMTNGIVFHYDGTMAAPVSTTEWNGNWEIECDKGLLRIENDQLFLVKEDGTTQISTAQTEEDSRQEVLREACRALRENRKGETDYQENLNTFRWMCKTIDASTKQEWVDVKD